MVLRIQQGRADTCTKHRQQILIFCIKKQVYLVLQFWTENECENLNRCVCQKLTFVTVAVSAAGDDHGIAQHVMTDQAEEFIGDGLLLNFRFRRRLWDERRLFLLPNSIRLPKEHKTESYNKKLHLTLFFWVLQIVKLQIAKNIIHHSHPPKLAWPSLCDY